MAAPNAGRLERGIALVLTGFVALWLILDRSAALLGSYRGEMGLLVCLIVLVAATGIEMALSGASMRRALTDLGLRRPNVAGTKWSVGLSVAMLGFYPVFSLVTGAGIKLRPDWLLLLPGLFAQGGIAEELVFRGFLFRHVRDGRSFRNAALLSSIPFVAVHLLLFLSMDFVIALAALLVAVSISFPLAWLFENSGKSIWPCALVHFVVQGSIKIVEAPGEHFAAMATVWMLLSATAPWLFFVVLRPSNEPMSEGKAT
jgi:membrane protease YdiL (CAAX protease family)